MSTAGCRTQSKLAGPDAIERLVWKVDQNSARSPVCQSVNWNTIGKSPRHYGQAPLVLIPWAYARLFLRLLVSAFTG